MRATWIKWTEDHAFTSSVQRPIGTLTPTVPCVFGATFCEDDPETGTRPEITTGVAWGSILPQLSAFTVALSGDKRHAMRMAAAAGRYTALLQRYSNTKSNAFPELLNVTSAIDGYNIGKQGWPSSVYGDWCGIHTPAGACTSVSTLLNSVYFILDIEAALSLLHEAGQESGGDSGGSPSAAELTSWLTQARNSFAQAFLHQIVVSPLPPSMASPGEQMSTNSVVGLSFRDPFPPNITHHGNPNTLPTAQAEAAAGMAAMDQALSQDDVTRAKLGEMLAGLVLNVSITPSALQVGGVIDMAQIGRSLISYGRPDAAFALLSMDGPTSFYHMAASTGTIWAHPGGADGDNGKCSSHNHVMQGGSVGEGVFGIGGIRPHFMRGEVPTSGGTQNLNRLLLAPVPWLPDAPRGAAVWRTSTGVASTSWAAQTDPELESSQWSVWVNVTVPIDSGITDVRIMAPQEVQSGAMCAWECGFGRQTTSTFKSQWVSFDNSTGHHKLTAVVPSTHTATARGTMSSACTPIWRSGASLKRLPVGIQSVVWMAAKGGSAMYPALSVAVGSGSYAFFAQAC